MTAPSTTQPDSIFVQIASYRDSQLIPTLRDLIDKARKPDSLRIVVCWQHASDEALGAFRQQGFGKWRTTTADGWTRHLLDYRGASVELIDVPHLRTRGACWARNLIQQRYDGERYTLQLDSHHRFVNHWDTRAIDMLESLRDESAKPVLTAYLPAFDPESDAAPNETPQFMCFDRFGVEGVVMFRGRHLRADEIRQRPVRARFYSAHFAFADGHFSETVQHDPDFFFLGEEISIAARAFTHGYDLYHPHRVIAWHEYTRRHRVKMWDDHTDQAKQRGDIDAHWVERDTHAYQRNRMLLGVDGQTCAQNDFGRYGLGTQRTLAEYEAYAGISFARRGVHEATLNHEPPQPPGASHSDDPAWTERLRRANDVRVCLHRNTFDEFATTRPAQGTLSAARAAVVTIHDENGIEQHCETIDTHGLSERRTDDWLDFHVIFVSALEHVPGRYSVELLDGGGNLLSRVEHAVIV
ncbi:GlcNAc-transferase family protein [Burkholderia cepacia]|uniref:GlcNAc-transferase family protein n=1 Tax=Burkholderia cepacia TaxID=292 RepID=UPI00352897E4